MKEVEGKFIDERGDKAYRLIDGVSYRSFRIAMADGIRGVVHVPVNVKAVPVRLVLEYAEND